jgi:hypothetical protein
LATSTVIDDPPTWDLAVVHVVEHPVELADTQAW